MRLMCKPDENDGIRTGHNGPWERGHRITVAVVVAIVAASLLVLAACTNPTGAGGDDGPVDGGSGDGGGAVGDPAWRVLDRLVAGDRGEGDELGTAVAVSSDTVVVGAPRVDGSARDTGAAYVFVRNSSGDWSEQQKLTAGIDSAIDDFFGSSVGISGDTVIVGAPGKDADGPTFGAGAAYVFVRGGDGSWTEQQKLTAETPQAGAAFGSAVAVSGDAATVGAPNEDRGAFPDAGVAYVFERDGNGLWGTPQPLTGDHDTPGGDLFGTSVSIAQGTLVIGASGDDDAGSNAGAAYVSMRGATVWSSPEKITASDGASGDQFGTSVAISGETAIIGAPFGNASFDVADSGAAYVFVLESDSGTYVEDQKLIASDAAFQDAFGTSVAISGTSAMVAASENDLNSTNEGSAYVFALDVDGIWREAAVLTATDGSFEDRFGTQVALDAEAGAIGAPSVSAGANNTGAAYPVRFE